MDEDFIRKLEKEKDHLDTVIEMVKEGKQRFRPPYQKRSLLVKENLKEISRSLDKLSEQAS